MGLYPLKNVAQELQEGLVLGFKLQYEGPRVDTDCKNLLSATQHSKELQDKIQKEINLGRIAGPYKIKPITNLRLSPVGVLPKSEGGWRMITHLSYPKQNSVNDLINPESCSVRYTSFDNVVDMVCKLGRGVKLGKTDIKSAFRLLLVNPSDFNLLGFKFQSEYYIDKCLPMGCSISCSLWGKFATFLHWAVVERSGIKSIDHYLDDFLFAGPEGAQDCEILMQEFAKMCKEFGVPIAEEKTCGPTTSLKFLGLIIDTVDRLVKIPEEKTLELILLLEKFLNRKKVTLKELQALVGALNFYSRAVTNSRAFNRRFYQAMSGIQQQHHFVRITENIKEDIRVWLQFLKSFNGTRYFPEVSWLDSSVLEFYTDSAGSAGCGAYFQGQWSFFEWPMHWKDSDISKDITFLELVPIVLSICIWGQDIQSKKIIMHIDNLALVEILNKQSSKSIRVMLLIRQFVLMVLQYNITFRAKHIEGIKNCIADSLSRKQWSEFRRLAPNADQEPREIPEIFLKMMSKLK